jgi:hypothetical protein
MIKTNPSATNPPTVEPDMLLIHWSAFQVPLSFSSAYTLATYAMVQLVSSNAPSEQFPHLRWSKDNPLSGPGMRQLTLETKDGRVRQSTKESLAFTRQFSGAEDST